MNNQTAENPSQTQNPQSTGQVALPSTQNVQANNSDGLNTSGSGGISLSGVSSASAAPVQAPKPHKSSAPFMAIGVIFAAAIVISVLFIKLSKQPAY